MLHDCFSFVTALLQFVACNFVSIVDVGLIQWIVVALENTVEVVSCPDHKQYTLLVLSGHETFSTGFFNATEIHCIILASGFVSVDLPKLMEEKSSMIMVIAIATT